MPSIKNNQLPASLYNLSLVLFLEYSVIIIYDSQSQFDLLKIDINCMNWVCKIHIWVVRFFHIFFVLTSVNGYLHNTTKRK